MNLRVLFFKSISLLGSTMGSKGEVAEILDHVAAGLARGLRRLLWRERRGL